jgi:hypothetical protein
MNKGEHMHAGIGLGSPFTSPVQTQPFGVSPYGVQGIGASPWGASPSGSQQSILQWLQVLPQQLQQVQQLSYVQQQLLQQLLQIVPAQLQQLQQVIQNIPQQLQQLLQITAQQQFGGGAQGILSGGLGQFSQTQGHGVPFQGVSPFSSAFAGSPQVM